MGEIVENNERRRQRLAGRPTDLNRDCILTGHRLVQRSQNTNVSAGGSALKDAFR